MNNQFKDKDAYINGIEVLEFYGHDDYLPGIPAYIGVLSSFFWVFAFLAWAALSFVRWDKR